MKLLLDTHILLWASEASPKLSKTARTLLLDQNNELFFSVCSLWEMVIKNGLSRNDFHTDVRVLRRNLIDNGYFELSISSEHALAVSTLPNHHKDPFDRLLVAQAMVEGFTLLTADSMLAKYPGSIRKL